VATYPPIGDHERDAALARIAERHLRYDDPRWSEAGTEARDVLAYLRRRRTELPYEVTAHDTWDELVLSGWAYWDERRRERELIHSALRRGLSLSEVGRYLGISTRQGTRDYLDRLDALVADHAHTQTTLSGPVAGDGGTDALAVWARSSRAHRGADVHATRARRRAARSRPSRQSWIDDNSTRITAAITELRRQLARLGVEDVPTGGGSTEAGLLDYLSWLAEDSDALGYTPATFATLGLVLGELRNHPALAAQAPNHGIRLAISGVDQLRSDFAALTGRAS
jgi:hypothetical protein